jgi:hypothetical protein
MSNVTKLFRSQSGFTSPYFVVDSIGNMIVSSLVVTGNRVEISAGCYISYNGVPLLTNTSLSSSIVNIPGTLTGITVGGPTSLTGNLTVSGGIVSVVSSSTGTLDNVSIGSITPNAAQFTTVRTTGNVTLDGAGNILINTSGTATISPAGSLTLGTAGISTTQLGNIVATTQNQTINFSPTGVGSVTVNPTGLGAIDNMTIGLTTPAAGQMTSLTLTANDESYWNAVSTPTNLRSQASTKRYAENAAWAIGFFTRSI